MYTFRTLGRVVTGIGVGMALLLGACEYPLDPGPDPEKAEQEIQSGIYNKYWGINGGIQICNPSAGLEGRFSHCMAWLNLGDIDVDKPGFEAGYEHDRVIVSNKDNGVEWFLLADVFKKSLSDPPVNLNNPQIQDPEWGMHPLKSGTGWRADSATGYLAILVQDVGDKWDGYIVRMADKKILRFANNQFVGNETPHVWMKTPPQVAYDEDATAQIDETNSVSDEYGATGWLEDTAKVRAFFGTKDVKIVWSKQEKMHFIDYSAQATVTSCNETSPLEGYYFDSPLISPDGEWIAYNLTDGKDCRAYVRPLAADGRAILADRPDSVTADPHWYYDTLNSTYSLVYIFGAEKKGPYDIHWKVKDFYKNGSTVAKGIGPAIPAQGNLLQSEFFATGATSTLIGLPFAGGVNLDELVCTGYRFAYIAEAL